MPAVSKAQQHLMGMVLAAKRGKLKSPSAEVKKVASGMSEKSAKDFAGTKTKGLPKKKGPRDSKRTMLASALM